MFRLFDVSKQVVGQMFVHGANVLLSSLGSEHSGNACVYYFLNVLLDTTLGTVRTPTIFVLGWLIIVVYAVPGVGVIYINLHFLTYLFSEKLNLKGFESGVYGDPPSPRFWMRQAAVYVLALTGMKLFVLGLYAVIPGIFKFGEWLLSWTWTGDGDVIQVIL